MTMPTLDRRRFLVGAGLAGAAAATPGWARTTGPSYPAVRALMTQYVASNRVAGLAAAIGRGTDAPEFIVAGRLAREGAALVTPDSLYRIYSMTKPITGMAAMMLVEDGRLGLDQDVGDFVPGFKRPTVLTDPANSLASRPAARPVTVRGLMTHTAGIGYIINAPAPLQREYARLGLSGGPLSRYPLPGLPKVELAPTLQAFADRIATLPLIADPGARWSYSAGLDVLGQVIAVASGMPFTRFLQTRLFDPLGMSSTFFVVPRAEVGRMTTNYGVAGQAQLPIDGGATSVFTDAVMPFGGGGLVSSPRDYDAFLRMLAGRGAIGRTRVMKEATALLGMSNLLPPGVVTAGTLAAGQGYGAGGRVTVAADARGSGIGTYGWGGAAATIGWVDPTRGVRASGFAQFMPDSSMPWTSEFGAAVYRSL